MCTRQGSSPTDGLPSTAVASAHRWSRAHTSTSKHWLAADPSRLCPPLLASTGGPWRPMGCYRWSWMLVAGTGEQSKQLEATHVPWKPPRCPGSHPRALDCSRSRQRAHNRTHEHWRAHKEGHACRRGVASAGDRWTLLASTHACWRALQCSRSCHWAEPGFFTFSLLQKFAFLGPVG